MLANQSILSDIKAIIAQSKDKAIRAVDHQRTLMYWHIGKRIFEEEQEGKDRADYGTFLIKYLSEQLQPEFGSGFSVRQINLYRQFIRTFENVHTLYAQLSWSQYKLLLSVDSQEKRAFYIAETIKNNWTVRQLERQIYSNLYERLLLSNDKESVLAVARKEKQPSDAKEIIKDPMYLEFLGLKRDIEGDEFFVDLVFYNRILQCFVIIEIKTHKLTHQDIGQLQMYVNYYDRIERLPHENPTIGILLCANKNDTVVKFTLPENQKQIIASQYKLYLPTEQQLLEEVNKELDSFKGKNDEL